MPIYDIHLRHTLDLEYIDEYVITGIDTLSHDLAIVQTLTLLDVIPQGMSISSFPIVCATRNYSAMEQSVINVLSRRYSPETNVKRLDNISTKGIRTLIGYIADGYTHIVHKLILQQNISLDETTTLAANTRNGSYVTHTDTNIVNQGLDLTLFESILFWLVELSEIYSLGLTFEDCYNRTIIPKSIFIPNSVTETPIDEYFLKGIPFNYQDYFENIRNAINTICYELFNINDVTRCPLFNPNDYSNSGGNEVIREYPKEYRGFRITQNEYGRIPREDFITLLPRYSTNDLTNAGLSTLTCSRSKQSSLYITIHIDSLYLVDGLLPEGIVQNGILLSYGYIHSGDFVEHADWYPPYARAQPATYPPETWVGNNPYTGATIDFSSEYIENYSDYLNENFNESEDNYYYTVDDFNLRQYSSKQLIGRNITLLTTAQQIDVVGRLECRYSYQYTDKTVSVVPLGGRSLNEMYGIFIKNNLTESIKNNLNTVVNSIDNTKLFDKIKLYAKVIDTGSVFKSKESYRYTFFDRRRIINKVMSISDEALPSSSTELEDFYDEYTWNTNDFLADPEGNDADTGWPTVYTPSETTSYDNTAVRFLKHFIDNKDSYIEIAEYDISNLVGTTNREIELDISLIETICSTRGQFLSIAMSLEEPTDEVNDLTDDVDYAVTKIKDEGTINETKEYRMSCTATGAPYGVVDVNTHYDAPYFAHRFFGFPLRAKLKTYPRTL